MKKDAPKEETENNLVIFMKIDILVGVINNLQTVVQQNAEKIKENDPKEWEIFEKAIKQKEELDILIVNKFVSLLPDGQLKDLEETAKAAEENLGEVLNKLGIKTNKD